MRDELMGRLLALGIAAPVMAVCGGGTALLAAAFGGFGAWISGFGGISVALGAALVFLVVREVRRAAKRRATSDNPSDRKSTT